ncbi:sugar kinase [Lentisphaera profundi]|uniref:Sugar kinase n=1 Tax=Lentisphaera profundi TaxID=1658616 RepID=A0ABY7VT88_9BACT|nr:sugar kinase [Lentisphaera profundi]WDE96937.1 sugar kinase [Lentisphaera profundi]
MKIKNAADCKYDILSLGEVMLRLDPGEGRVRNTRKFNVCEGGGEYNVARGLKRCFGQRAAIVTALADNDIGYLVEDLMYQGGVNQEYVKWVPYDGCGRTVRNGLNFTERGFGLRSALGISDRGNTAVSQLKKGDIDWEKIFGEDGVRWFHTGGIFAALSETTPDAVLEAVQIAKKHGTIVSYDLNFRPSLWNAIGGEATAQKVNREIAKYVDVMIGNEEDFTACLGLEIEGVDHNLTNLEASAFHSMIKKASEDFPNFQAIATTMRGVKTATINDWSAVAWSREDGFVESAKRNETEILDRVGGGDSFASGLIYGYMIKGSIQEGVEYGAAHGALAMTTAGDTTTARLNEVERLVAGAGARVIR